MDANRLLDFERTQRERRRGRWLAAGAAARDRRHRDEGPSWRWLAWKAVGDFDLMLAWHLSRADD
jgi:hypothetical protein